MKKSLFKNPITLFQTREQEISNWIFFILKRNFFAIPISVKLISFSLFLFTLGWWLGADTFFSLYLEVVVKNVFLVSIIAAILPLSKMFFSLPIGELDDHTDLKRVLFISKILYSICWVLFFWAGFFHSPWILLWAVVFNGFANATLFTTYEAYIHLVNRSHDDRTSWGLYFSSINAAYVIWAIISYFLVQFIPLEYLYLFIVLFSIVSLTTDKMIPILSFRKARKVLVEWNFLKLFFKEVFSFGPFKRTYTLIKTYPKSLFYILGFEFLFNLLNYIWFLFIPLVSTENHLSLSQVALIFAAMRLPYLSNLFTAGRTSRYHKKQFILISFLFMAILYGAFAFNTSFWGTMILSFGISMILATIRPLISTLLSENTDQKHAGQITGIQHFVGTFGNVIWALGFGILSKYVGMEYGFLFVGLFLFILSGYGIWDRYKKRPLVNA